MKILGNIIVFLLGIAVVTAFIGSIIYGIKFLITQFGLLDSASSAQVIIGSSLILICTLILAGAIRYSKSAGDRPVHPEKAAIYSDYINYFIALREGIKINGRISYRFRSDITLWANKNVLKSYLIFNILLDKLSPDDPKIMEQAEKILFEMRKELGQDNFGLKKGDLDKIIFPGNHQVTKNNSQEE
jgi:hypothetical protein